MKSIRHARPLLGAVVAALLSAEASEVLAQIGPMVPPSPISVLGSFEDGQLNHWYLSQSSTLASVAGESAGDDAGTDSAYLPGLAKPITKGVAGQYDTASAYAGILPTKLSVAAFTSTGQSSSDIHALGFAMAGASYFTIMDQPGTVTMTLHLSGTLSSLTLGSKAAMSLIAIGSGVDAGLLNTLDQGSLGSGVDVPQSMESLPRINDAHAQVFSALHADGSGGTDAFDQDFSVSAEGLEFACAESGAGQAYCGKYLYAFSLGLQAASTNNAHADFAHTLTVTGLQLPQGTTLSFEPGTAIPTTTTAVPEASTGFMTLMGIGMVAGSLARRRRPH